MKKKIALLLATVMTCSMLPMNLFAASSNHFTKTPAAIPGSTLLYEESFPGMDPNDGTTLWSWGPGSPYPERPSGPAIDPDPDPNPNTSGSALVATATPKPNSNADWELGERILGSKLYEVSDSGVIPKGLKNVSDDAIEYAVEGSNFVIRPSDNLRSGDVFRVRLENAKWFFRAAPYAVSASNASNELKSSLALANGFIAGTPSAAALTAMAGNQLGLGNLSAVGDDDDDWDYNNLSNPADGQPDTRILSMTYNPENGVYANVVGGEVWQTYFRTKTTADKNISGQGEQIPYQLQVSRSDPSVATVTILGEKGKVYQPDVDTKKRDIVIPLVARTTGDKDVKVQIQSSLTGVSSGTYIYGVLSGGAVSFKAVGQDEARETFTLDRLEINESRISSLGSDGSIKITLPRGFYWAELEKSRVIAEPGVYWKNSDSTSPVRNDIGKRLENHRHVYPGGSTTTHNYRNVDEVIHYLHYGRDNLGEKVGDYMSGNINYWEDNVYNPTQGKYNFDYALGYNFIEESSTSYRSNSNHEYDDGHFTVDDNSIVLSVAGLERSTKIPGSLYIEDLKFFAEEDAPFGDIVATIKDYKNDDDLLPNEGTVKVGKRVEYGVVLTADKAPTLIAGRYEDYNSIYFDDYQQAAHIKIKETTTNSWWSGRQTILELPTGVKFAQVDITDTSEIAEGDRLKDGVSAYGGDGIYRNDGKKQGFVTVDDNKITIANIKVNAGEKGSIDMDLWLSIVADYPDKEIPLKLTGSAIPEGEESTAIIAKVLNPVTITTKTSDIKIGYQYQKTSDITLTETQAGNLVRGGKVNVSVTDLVSTDVEFSPTTSIAVTDGDLKIKNITTIGSGSYIAGIGSGSNAISFDIDKESTKASTISITNVSVKVDRSVPVTNNRPYDVVVWGSAVAKNFNTTSNAKKDHFSTPGIKASYIRVVTPAGDKSDIMSAEVRVSIGERSYTVNGASHDMDAAAYISTASNSTMVPLRFVANAFGIGDDGIIWDDVNRTVTIIHPTRVLQFAIGSQMMLINGVATTMMSPDGLAVSAEITNERSYVPFRALGEAFGVPVAWDAETNTAIYNKGANLMDDADAPIE